MNHLQAMELFDVLRKHPQGITAKDAAVELRRPVNSTSSQLSKLAIYQRINRCHVPGTRTNQFVYKLREPA